MPGLFGVLGPRHDTGLQDLAKSMSQRMRHHSWYRSDLYCDIDGGVALGRESLGYIQTAPQPVWSNDRSLCLILEGELYNTASLRQQLVAAGRQVPSHIDHADLLLQGFLQFGQRFFRELNGYFIAAIWDVRARKLILANDRFGMKPLYYSHLPGKLLFASEIKSLLADPAVSHSVSRRGISQFFSYGQFLGEETFFTDVKALPAAAWIVYSQATDELQVDRYWRLTDISYDSTVSKSQFLERIDDVFAKAVDGAPVDHRRLASHYQVALIRARSWD